MAGRLFALLALGALSVGTVRADLYCPAVVQDVGQVSGGKRLVHTFNLTNRGMQTIEIVEIKPSCGCLRPHVAQTSLKPGDEIKLNVEVNTLTQREGANRWGCVVKYLDAGQLCELPLTVTAHIQPAIHIQPANMVIYTDSTATHSFTLIERNPTPLRLQKVVSNSPHIGARHDLAKKEGDSWVRQIHLDVKATCPEGRHEDVLHLISGDGPDGVMTAPFTVVKRIRGKVGASPALVSISAVDEDSPSRIVLLGTMDDEKVSIEKVETSDALIRCTFAEGPGNRATLRVTVDGAGVGKNGLNGQVRVSLKQPAPQVVTVPVQVGGR